MRLFFDKILFSLGNQAISSVSRKLLLIFTLGVTTDCASSCQSNCMVGT